MHMLVSGGTGKGMPSGPRVASALNPMAKLSASQPVVGPGLGFTVESRALQRHCDHAVEAEAVKRDPCARTDRREIVVEVRRFVPYLRQVKKGVGLDRGLFAQRHGGGSNFGGQTDTAIADNRARIVAASDCKVTSGEFFKSKKASAKRQLRTRV